ncbi:unnamed protein product [Sphagnum balticum]
MRSSDYDPGTIHCNLRDIQEENQLKRKQKQDIRHHDLKTITMVMVAAQTCESVEKTGACKETSLQLELRLLSQENKSHYSNPKRTNEYCLTQETHNATEQARKLPDLIGVTLPTSFRVRVRNKFVLVPLS